MASRWQWKRKSKGTSRCREAKPRQRVLLWKWRQPGQGKQPPPLPPFPVAGVGSGRRPERPPYLAVPEYRVAQNVPAIASGDRETCFDEPPQKGLVESGVPSTSEGVP